MISNETFNMLRSALDSEVEQAAHRVRFLHIFGLQLSMSAIANTCLRLEDHAHHIERFAKELREKL